MITSKENPHFKQLIKLHKKRERDKTGLYLVEGEREVSLASHLEVLYYTEETFSIPNVSCECIQIASDLFAQVTYRDKGVIAVARKEKKTLADLASLDLLLLVQGIEKPGNLGAMMRSCDGAGATGLIVCDPVCDIYNPNVIRASLGSFFRLCVVEADALEAVHFLKEKGVNIVVTTPHVQNIYYYS